MYSYDTDQNQPSLPALPCPASLPALHLCLPCILQVLPLEYVDPLASMLQFMLPLTTPEPAPPSKAEAERQASTGAVTSRFGRDRAGSVTLAPPAPAHPALTRAAVVVALKTLAASGYRGSYMEHTAVTRARWAGGG